jgi:hypothetical protein
MLFEDLQNATLFEARFIMPPSLDRTKDMNDHAIWGDDDMVLQTVHSLPPVKHKALVTCRAADFL